MQSLDWNDITDTIEEQKCVLFLGQSAYHTAQGITLRQALLNDLDAHNVEHPHIRLYNSDGFFLFREDRFERKVVRRIKKFYEQEFPVLETQLARLAQIPFNMIFSLGFDNLLPRTFEQHGLQYQRDFYFKHRPPNPFQAPSKQVPLLYNLLGNIDEPESIVLTQQAFFDYLKSIFTGSSMHEDLRSALESADSYIFLGLPYERWYFQILLRVLAELSINSDRLKKVERIALKEFENPKLRCIYTEEFKIEFVPSDVENFVNTLYEECQNKGILKAIRKKESTKDVLPITAIRELITAGKIEQALAQCKALLLKKQPQSANLLNDLIALSARYQNLQQQKTQGIISFADQE
ncbi:MAG: SIR2 family protein, partial [Bacteroidota bacterium]